MEPPIFGSTMWRWYDALCHCIYMHLLSQSTPPISPSLLVQMTGSCWFLHKFHYVLCAPHRVKKMKILLIKLNSTSMGRISLSFSTLCTPCFFSNINQIYCLHLQKLYSHFSEALNLSICTLLSPPSFNNYLWWTKVKSWIRWFRLTPINFHYAL